MKNEVWKDIPGYEGLYMASNLGRIKKLSKKNNVKDSIYNRKTTHTSYKGVSLKKDGERKSYKVATLIAITFLDHIQCGHKIVIDHINNIKYDDRVSNLQLISHRENCTKEQFRCKRSSKYIGVNWDKYYKKWRSQIRINGKSKQLGLFENEIKASDAYQKELSFLNGL